MTTQEEPLRRSAPERIGRRYLLQERIGRGAMGVVYRARDEYLSRDVALKVLTADFEDDEDIRARFHREAEAAASLQHPSIINILDVGEDGHRFYIVMELLRGLPLKEFLKSGDSASRARKLELMIQLCAGIHVAHKAGIFHRDIKPGNLFVRADGILKILDFGVARLASSNMTASGFIVGTPDYMSPEQACGAEIDCRSDIFSIGGVFYYMLSGRKPFSAAHLPTLFHQIQCEAPPALTAVPPELAAMTMKALAKSPDDRYQSCADMVTELEQLRATGALEHEVDEPSVAASAGATGAAAPPSLSLPPPSRGDADTDDTVQLAAPSSASRGSASRVSTSRASASSASAFEAAIDTDDTVCLVAQPSWWQEVTQRCLELAVGALARVRRATTPPRHGGGGPRKGWM